MRHILLVLLTISVSACVADNVYNRQTTALEYHYTNVKYPVGQPRGNVVRAYSIFALASDGNQQITSADIAEANELLDVLYTSWPIADETNGLYWMLPHISRILADDELNVYLTASATESLKNVLYSFVYDNDDIAYASTSLDIVWHVSGSENHDILKKQVYFTASQIFKNNPEWSSLTYADGKTVAEHHSAWDAYFETYFSERAKKGLNIEVGSPTYAGVFLESIFIIFDLAENKTLQKRAWQFLNLYFTDQALCSLNGVRGGAKSRCYKDAPSYSYSSDKGAFYSWMLTGEPVAFNSGNTPYDIVPALTSDFRINDVVAAIYDQDERDAYEYIVSRPGKGTHTGTYPEYSVVFPSMTRWYSWCTPEFILGSVTLDEAEAYTLISDQNRWYGLIASDNVASRLYFTPDTANDNSTYKDYIAVQSKGAMLIRKHKDAENVGFRMFASGSFTTSQESGWVFGYNSQSSVYFGLYATFADLWAQRYTITSASEVWGKWITFNISDTTAVLEVAQADDFTDFTDFKEQVKANAKGFSGSKYDYTSLNGDVLSIYSDTTLPQINSQTVALDTEYTYNSPFLTADYDSHIIDISDYDGNTLTLDFTEPYIVKYLDSDLNRDGYVNLEDIAFLAAQWQSCTNPIYSDCVNMR